ncbi:hypothetical protein AOQ84DRAFT_100899 [Glonium stellatum]|uniref:DUF427 domain-containing protein n=1 Tax=Glonium stellatum TaxID=574774 RepID=A0A8E2EUS4_9PEZI|nr:hypothetical protein AOQ84DRAFT_100899 [Glonium stellatum]
MDLCTVLFYILLTTQDNSLAARSKTSSISSHPRRRMRTLTLASRSSTISLALRSHDLNLKDAAWYFPDPKLGFERLKDYVAFRATGIDDIRGLGLNEEAVHIGNDPFA